jgi:hypothetical protein
MRRLAVRLTPPVKIALEKALASIEDENLWESRRSRSDKPLLDQTRASALFAPRKAGESTQHHHEGDRGDQPERDVAPARAARFGVADFRDRSFG